MKQLLTILTFLLSATVFGQTTIQNDSINFCSIQLKIPTGCKIKTATNVQCESYSVEWKYANEKDLYGLETSYLQIGNMLENFKKKRLSFYLVDKKIKSYKVSYKNATGTTFQIYVSGVINGQGVYVILTLDKEPNNNNDIPEFAQQIIRFEK